MDMDAQTEAALAACDTFEAFERAAAERGVAFTPQQRASAARPDPTGAMLFMPFPANARHWPSSSWLPVNLAAMPEPAIDWVYVGDQPPYLDRFALRRAMDRPFNRVFRKRMLLGDFIDGAEAARDPAGLLFHMGRCGSTLAARMMAAVPGVGVLSELPVVSHGAALAATAPLADERRLALLRAIVAAYGGRDPARRLVVRFEAHTALAIALAARAFARTPIAFLYRDPVEVVVAYERDGGIQGVFGGYNAALWDAAEIAQWSNEDVVFPVLARICGSAVSHLASHGGLAVNYRDMPGAVADAILPHFRIEADDAARVAMRDVARTNAKVRDAAFTDDSAEKQRLADETLRARAGKYLDASYRALEKLAAP
jgi:hypothetical protein